MRDRHRIAVVLAALVALVVPSYAVAQYYPALATGVANTWAAVQTFTLAPVLSTATITANGDTLTIQDLGSANFVQSEGAQTINGVKTLGSAPVLSSGTLTVNADLITFQDLGAANVVVSEGTQTINGAKTFGTAPTITGGLTAANIQTGSAKRQTQTVRLAPETAACADATVYRGNICFGRAGTVTRISYGTMVDPVSGTNVIAVEKGTYSGNTLFSTATVDLNGNVAGVVAQGTLTGTGADLALLASESVCCEYNAGTQGTDAEQVFVTVEFEPTNF